MMTLTRFGLREWGIGLIVAVLLVALTQIFLGKSCPKTAWILTGVWVLFFFCLAAFFRNPVREIPQGATLLVSPADGLVRDIEVVPFDQSPFQGEALRIGIFLSVFNVHVNRACADVKIESVQYREGYYLDARNPDCAKVNEAMTIAGTATLDGKSFPLGIRQISGAIARRIVCPVLPGRELAKGEIYGMIKFGSRTEIYLPKDRFDLKINIGDKVYGGKSVIAAIK